MWNFERVPWPEGSRWKVAGDNGHSRISNGETIWFKLDTKWLKSLGVSNVTGDFVKTLVLWWVHGNAPNRQSEQEVLTEVVVQMATMHYKEESGDLKARAAQQIKGQIQSTNHRFPLAKSNTFPVEMNSELFCIFPNMPHLNVYQKHSMFPIFKYNCVLLLSHTPTFCHHTY